MTAPMHDLVERILSAHGRDGDAAEALVLADWLLERGGDPRLLAAALDRAYGLQPADPFVVTQRAAALDALALVEHGLRFRYVPAGTFLMGSDAGDPDERPVHPVRLDGFWIADAPITWTRYCALMEWSPPPDAMPQLQDPKADLDRDQFAIYVDNKIRRSYCEHEVPEPVDGSASTSADTSNGAAGANPGAKAKPRGRNAGRPWLYDTKPMVAVSYAMVEALCARLSTDGVTYRLPTEAEWEKAARGGLVGARYSWGDAPPDPTRCDFGHFGRFHVRPPRELPPNGYGIYGMCGGVCEWTSDTYDALAYRADRPPVTSETSAPAAPAPVAARVLRGGSWADCAAAVTVSFRHAPAARRVPSPNIGMRIVRAEQAPTILPAT